MEKEFVTYEQALALKELGFYELCLFYYGDNEIFRMYNQSEIEEDLIGAPLKQQAFRWFREKHDMLSYIDVMLSESGENIYDYVIVSDDDYTFNDEMKWDTYEQAESACLDKLIEIVKTNEQ